MIEDYAPGLDLTTPANLECSVIGDLLHLPAEIKQLQDVFDRADYIYRRTANSAALHGLGVEIFTSKDGAPRCASNERERDLAIEAELTMDLDAVEALEVRNEALRNLQEAKNRFEAAQLIAKLIARGNR